MKRKRQNDDEMSPLLTDGSEPKTKKKKTASDEVEIERGSDPTRGMSSTRWIPLCRSKLKVRMNSVSFTHYLQTTVLSLSYDAKEREITLHQKRLRKCTEIINQSIDQFTRQNIKCFIELHGECSIRVQRMDRINHEMMQHFLSDEFIEKTITSCSAALAETLQRWKGVLKSKKFSAADDVEFYDYFTIAKNWMDQRKVKMMTEVFWIPLFAVIEQVL